MRRMIAQRLEGSRFGVYLATLANFVSGTGYPSVRPAFLIFEDEDEYDFETYVISISRP
jgi:hypothetical protein